MFWTRITQKYDAAYVDMPLVNYHLGHTQSETIQDQAAADAARVRKNIRETCHILEKNSSYFAEYKYAHWIKLSGLALSYRKNGELGKSFGTFAKAVIYSAVKTLREYTYVAEDIISVQSRGQVEVQGMASENSA